MIIKNIKIKTTYINIKVNERPNLLALHSPSLPLTTSNVLKFKA